MVHELEKLLMPYEMIKITEANVGEAMEVYHTNPAFFLLTQGKEATLENSIHDMTALPPNYNPKGKLYVSLWENGSIIGVMDLLTGYPQPDCLWIGLLLIHGECRCRKHGSKIVSALLEAAKNTGYARVQLGVIHNNEPGIHFWRKCGFQQIREATTERDHQEALRVIVMERQIQGASKPRP